jgi:hypothetical protein
VVHFLAELSSHESALAVLQCVCATRQCDVNLQDVRLIPPLQLVTLQLCPLAPGRAKPLTKLLRANRYVTVDSDAFRVRPLPSVIK